MAETLCMFLYNAIVAQMLLLYHLGHSWNKGSSFQFMPVFTKIDASLQTSINFSLGQRKSNSF